MKRLFYVVPLVCLLCIFLIESKPIQAQEWTAEQKEIVAWFNKYTEVSLEGNLEGICSYYHPEFSGWDYSKIMNEGVPFDKAWLKNSQVETYKNFKLILFEVEPLVIKVTGNIAVVHVNMVEKLQDSNGNETTYFAPWTSTLIKQDGKWLFFSWSFTLKN